MKQSTAINVIRPSMADRPSIDGQPSSFLSASLKKLAAEKPVLVAGRRGCYMIHVAMLLLQGIGANPAAFEIGEDAELAEEGTMLPLVFIGGRLVGGLDRLMAVHISGDLVPILKEAGALWL